jgi:O-antigen/teichoic acid export membrane protein
VISETAERPNDDARQFARTVAGPARFQLVSNIARAVLLFLHQLLIARLFGAYALGLFSLATAAAQVASMVSHLGGDYVILRGGRGDANTRDPSTAFGYVLLPATLASAITAALLVVSATRTTLLGVDSRIPGSVAIVAPTIIASCTIILGASLLQATGQLRRYTIVQTLLDPALRVATLLVLLTISRSWAVPLWSYTVAVIVTFAVALTFVRSAVSPTIKVSDWIEGARGLSYSIPVMLSFALQFATVFVNIAIISRLLSSEAAGIFAAAMRLAMLSLWAQTAISAPLLPLIAEGLASKRGELRATYQRAVRFVMIVNVPLLAGLFVARTAVMGIFGDAFVLGAAALAWMLVGQFINTATAAIEAMFPLGGKPKLGLTINALQLIGNALLAWYLVPRLGVSGAGVAVGVSVIATNVLRTYLVWRTWRITPLSTDLLRMLACGVVVVLAWETLRPALNWRPDLPATLVGAALLSALVLVICLRFASREDREILRRMVMVISPRH